MSEQVTVEKPVKALPTVVTDGPELDALRLPLFALLKQRGWEQWVEVTRLRITLPNPLDFTLYADLAMLPVVDDFSQSIALRAVNGVDVLASESVATDEQDLAAIVDRFMQQIAAIPEQEINHIKWRRKHDYSYFSGQRYFTELFRKMSDSLDTEESICAYRFLKKGGGKKHS